MPTAFSSPAKHEDGTYNNFLNLKAILSPNLSARTKNYMHVLIWILGMCNIETDILIVDGTSDWKICHERLYIEHYSSNHKSFYVYLFNPVWSKILMGGGSFVAKSKILQD